jgi:hypothetical protein
LRQPAAEKDRSQAQQDCRDRTSSMRQHDDDRQHCQDKCLDDRPRDRHSLRRQRRSDKDETELDGQQHRQARISDLILPRTERSAAVADGEGDAPAVRYNYRLWHGKVLRLRRPRE